MSKNDKNIPEKERPKRIGLSVRVVSEVITKRTRLYYVARCASLWVLC
jgi:hypothetical protein